MRATQLLFSAAMAFSVMTAPANAAWHSYISHQLGFSFEAPGDVKTTVGTYRGSAAGPKQTIVYRSVDDNIEYKVTVIPSFRQAQAEGANILGEREYMFQNDKKVLMDTFGRVEPGKDSIYGRKMTVELPKNGGRETAAFYFINGNLITLEATVLPANGDYTSPNGSRFVESLWFNLTTDNGHADRVTPPPE
jgi:hypothetical protein